MRKPREFWLSCIKLVWYAFEAKPSHEESIRVIEYSAYEDAQRICQLRTDVINELVRHQQLTFKERDRYKAALEVIASTECYSDSQAGWIVQHAEKVLAGDKP